MGVLILKYIGCWWHPPICHHHTNIADSAASRIQHCKWMLNPRFNTVNRCCFPRINSLWGADNREHLHHIWCVIIIIIITSTIVYRGLHWSWDRNNEQNIGASLSLYAYLFFLTSWLVSFIIGSRTCIVIAQKLSPWSYIPQCCVFDLNTWCFISRYSIVATILREGVCKMPYFYAFKVRKHMFMSALLA